MPIDPSTVTVGCCYETASNQQRKVVELVTTPEGIRVRYFSRGGNAQNDWAWAASQAMPPLLETFADAVDAAIPCPAAAPPPGFDLLGRRSPIRVWDLSSTSYPHSAGGRVTFSLTEETGGIWNGDQLTDSSIPGAPTLTVSQVWKTDSEIQMVLT